MNMKTDVNLYLHKYTYMFTQGLSIVCRRPHTFFLYIFLNLFILYSVFFSNISHFQGNSKVQIESFFEHTACNNVFYVSPIISLTFYYVIHFCINS